jgi:membrane protein implicated in regulation of membrane protease activity
VISRQVRSRLYLAAVPLAAFAIALVLALASVAVQHSITANGARALRTSANRPAGADVPNPAAHVPIAAPRSEPATPRAVLTGEPPSLSTALAPWALAADAFAVLGMIAVLALRYVAGRRGGPQA